MAKEEDNGNVTLGDLQALKQELLNYFADIEEKIAQAGSGDKARLLLYEMLYKTEDKYILELSNINGLQVRPIAIVETLEHIGDPEVKKGTISLEEIYVRKVLRLRRSVEAKHLQRGIMLAGEQIGAGAEEELEAGGALELGRER